MPSYIDRNHLLFPVPPLLGLLCGQRGFQPMALSIVWGFSSIDWNVILTHDTGVLG